MIVSVIFDDGAIVVDREARMGFDFSTVDSNWHALQWGGASGWIEVKQGDRIWLETDELVQPFVTMFNAAAPVAAPPPVPQSISRRQCARQLFAMGMITGAEAVAMTRNGTPPAMVQTYLDTLPEADRYVAEMDFAADTYLRVNLLLNAIMAAGKHSPADVDQFFIAAAML